MNRNKTNQGNCISFIFFEVLLTLFIYYLLFIFNLYKGVKDIDLTIKCIWFIATALFITLALSYRVAGQPKWTVVLWDIPNENDYFLSVWYLSTESEGLIIGEVPNILIYINFQILLIIY